MASYNFLKQAKVYVVDSSNQRRQLDVSSVEFSQTFTENSYKVKTLHSQNMFEGSVINKANPANFSMNVNAIQEADNKVIFDRLLDYSTFDMYVVTEESTFKIEYCVVSNGSFNIRQGTPLSLEISGEARKLSRVGTGSYSLPGTLVAKTASPTHNQLLHTSVTLGGSDISSETVSLSVELQNDIQWSSYATVHDGVAVTSDSNTIYPTDYTIQKRILAGNIKRFLTDSSSSAVQAWDTDTTLNIKAGVLSSGSLTQGFEFDITNCSYTNRAEVGDLFTQSYDWRMTQNPTSLTDVITYITT